MLEIQRLRKLFHTGSPDERVAIDDVSLTLNRGDFAVVVGGNGAGKSTLLNMIAGEVIPDSGLIQIDGENITRLPTYKRARHMSRVFQDPSVGTAASLSIEENLSVAARRGLSRTFGRGLSSHLVSEFHSRLEAFGLGLETRMKTHAGLLSGGQRQALSLLMAVFNKPLLLLLDEHTAALDPKTAEKVMQVTSQVVAESGLTTLMVTHNMSHAIAYGNRLIMMQQGRILADLSGSQKRAMTTERLVAAFDDHSLLHAA